MTTPQPSPTAAPSTDADAPRHLVMLGNPNTGKTSLFNRLCGVRHKTSNFPGTTQEARLGTPRGMPEGSELIDLPGIYSLELAQSEAEICRRVRELGFSGIFTRSRASSSPSPTRSSWSPTRRTCRGA